MERQDTPLGTTSLVSMSQASDEALFLAYRNHDDQAALDVLIRRYDRELFGYLRRYLRRADLAEEVFQSTFIQLHRKKDQFEEGRRFRPWLYSIATHLAVDLLRRRGRRYAVSLDRPAASSESQVGNWAAQMASPAPGPLAQLEDAEQRTWVRRAVEDLPEHLRSTVMLAFFQGLKYEEVAETLGVPLGTVKSRINAAMKRLTAAREQAEAARRQPSRRVRSGRAVRRSAQSTDCGYPLRAGARHADAHTSRAKPRPPVRQVLSQYEGDFSDVEVPADLVGGTCDKVHQCVGEA